MQIHEVLLDEARFFLTMPPNVIAEASRHMGSAENPMQDVVHLHRGGRHFYLIRKDATNRRGESMIG